MVGKERILPFRLAPASDNLDGSSPVDRSMEGEHENSQVGRLRRHCYVMPCSSTRRRAKPRRRGRRSDPFPFPCCCHTSRPGARRRRPSGCSGSVDHLAASTLKESRLRKKDDGSCQFLRVDQKTGPLSPLGPPALGGDEWQERRSGPGVGHPDGPNYWKPAPVGWPTKRWLLVR